MGASPAAPVRTKQHFEDMLGGIGYNDIQFLSCLFAQTSFVVARRQARQACPYPSLLRQVGSGATTAIYFLPFTASGPWAQTIQEPLLSPPAASRTVDGPLGA